MSRESSRARLTPPAGAGRLAAFAVPAAIAALVPAGAVVPHAPSTAARQAPAVSDISTVAGGVGGPAKATRVAVSPDGHPFFSGGSLYVGDGGVLRGISLRTDWLTTLAGNGSIGPLGDGGPATAATLDGASGIARDHSGNLVIASGNRIRLVAAKTGTFYGQAMSKGDIYTVAGGGTGFGDGGPATQATLNGAFDVAVDRTGNLVINDRNDYRIRVVAARTGGFYGKAMTAGDIYTVAGTSVPGYSGDGGPAWHAELAFADGAAVDRAGNLVIGDTGNNRIRVVADSTGTFYGQAMTKGDIYTIAGTGTEGFAGDGGPAASAELNFPDAVAVDAAGNLVLSDANNFRIRVVAAKTGTFYGRAMTVGDIYTVAGDGTGGYSGDGGPATGAELRGVGRMAVDAAGNLVLPDTGNTRIRVVAESTGIFYGRAMTKGDIYTVAGDGSFGYSGDGGPATSAKLQGPEGVAVDVAGNLVITDTGNNRIRVVAESTGSFYGRAMTAGDIYTVAGDGTNGYSGDGGPATQAELAGPFDTVADAAGNLVIADSGNNRVRVVAGSTGTFYGQAMTKGDIYTVAGDGTAGFAGDGGAATGAMLWNPEAVAVDAPGGLLIADTLNGRIRAAG